MVPLTAVAQPRPWTALYPEEAAAANKNCAAGEFAECRGHLLRLLELLDGRADIVYRLAKVEASLGHRDAAMERLSLYSKMGLQPADPATDAAFDGWKESPDFQAILARMKAAASPVSGSKVFATLAEKDLIAEDIAYDSLRDTFYVSSVRHRKILSLSRDGKWRDFASEGHPCVWPVLALAADSARRHLWATMAAMPEGLGYTAADEGKSAVLKFSLDSGKLLKRYDLPPGGKHALGDMTLSAAGDAYIADGFGSVYMVHHRRDRLELLFPPGTFLSPQTPALSPGGGTLFVPDYARGISIVNLATKEWKLLKHPAELWLGGIDGLYLSGRTMVAIQNGTAPPRLIRMQLNAALTQVLQWETLEANWHGLGDPTHGVLVGDQFYFIANSGWDVKPGGVYEAATIRRMNWK